VTRSFGIGTFEERRGMRRSAVFAVAAVGIIALLAGAARSGATGHEKCTTSGPRVCISVTSSPNPVSPSTDESTTYILYSAVIANRSYQKAEDVEVDVALPDGSEFVSASPSTGTCSGESGSVDCELGTLSPWATAKLGVVVTAPAQEGQAAATFTVTFVTGSDHYYPEHHSLQTVVLTEVKATEGDATTFVPAGASVTISTDPTGTGIVSPADPQSADAIVTTSPTSVTASLEEVAGPLDCPVNTVCRGGDWVLATIPGTFDPPLAFVLRWDRTLVPKGQKVKNFVVLRTTCLDGCPIEKISQKCKSRLPTVAEVPCLANIRKKHGDWTGTLFDTHNGYMK
jgi:hypothetical protein